MDYIYIKHIKKISFNSFLISNNIILFNKTNKYNLNKSNLEQEECVLDKGFTLTKTIDKLFIDKEIYKKVSKKLVSLTLDSTFIISLISWCLIHKI